MPIRIKQRKKASEASQRREAASSIEYEPNSPPAPGGKPIRSILFTLVLALLLPFSAAADDQAGRIRVSDLEKTPIVATPLKIRVAKLRD
ncbi:MAG: hypothetical protein DMF60_04820 [Acidobacteria bacterium]|nr:MAG: hypothetical protein DMF60_04820 [Acidobacteriota bacterium]